MDCWDILQISPTNDERAIRKAYAKLLKTTRPDDDAAAYQALREAFDQALAIAPYYDDETDADNAPPFAEDDAWAPSQNDGFLPENAEISDGLFECEPPYPAESVGYRPSENAAQPMLPFADAREAADTLHRQYHQGGGKALLKLWPQFAARLQGLSAEEYGLLREHIAVWLAQPTGLPKKLITLWRAHFEIAPERPEEPSEMFQTAILGSSPQRVLDEVQRIYRQDYSAGLKNEWPHIRSLLDTLALEDIPEASWLMLDFLCDNHITDPFVWSQWTQHFRWHEDRAMAYRLDNAELERLYGSLRIGEIFSIDNSHTRNPIFGRLLRLAQQGKLQTAAVYAALLDTEIKAEMSEEERKTLLIYDEGYRKISDAQGRLKWVLPIAAVFLVGLGLNLMTESVLQTALAPFSALFFGLAVFVGAFMAFVTGIVISTQFMPDAVAEYSVKWALHRKIVLIRMFVLPAVSVGLVYYAFEYLQDDLPIFWAGILMIYAWGSRLLFFDNSFFAWLKVNLPIIGLLVAAAAFPALYDTTHIVLVFACGVIWLNANLYLRHFYHGKMSQWMNAVQHPFQTASVWQKPLRLVGSVFGFLLLLPSFCAEYVETHKPFVFGGVALFLLTLLPLPEPRGLWLYPVLFAVGGVWMLLKQFALRRLQRVGK